MEYSINFKLDVDDINLAILLFLFSLIRFL